MRNYFKTFALLLLMAVCSMGVWAETAVLSMNLGENGAVAASANSITGATGSAAEGWTIAITGNAGKSWSAGNGSISYNEVSYTTLKNSNGAQNTVTLPEGCAATHVTFYVTTNADAAGNLYEFNGVTVNVPVSSIKDYSNPTVIEQDLDYATSFTFTFNTQQVCFVAIVAYSVAEIAPADVFTFGLISEIAGTEIQSVGTRVSGCSHVETSALQTTYQTLANRTLYHGSTDAFTAPVAHRNMNLSNVVIKTQDGENDGAENHGAYMAFTLNIEEDYSLNLREISSDLYVEAKNNWYYEYVIEKGGVELYKSPVQTIASGQSGTDHSNSIATLRWISDLQGLTGEITVKLIWWINSGGTTLALKDFNVAGALKVSDNPHVEFGMGRDFADATHFEEGVEKLIGSAPAPLTVALHNGTGLDETTTDKALYHGTSENAVTAPTSYRNKCYATQEVANGVFLDNLYWGFSVGIPIGYSMSISQLYGDFYAEKNNIQYKMGVYTSDADDAEPLFISAVKEGNIQTMGDVAMTTVNTAEVAALQNLQGKIYLRFYWNIASSAAYAALKDFKIRALIEPVPGEGVKGLVFTDFEPAKNPTFTEGDVTASFSNANNNDISPASENRGVRMQSHYGITSLKVEVPADSYISEVVFVWNKKGNLNGGTNYLDLLITNSSDVQVSTLQESEQKNETTWSCGEVRESELTFAQQNPGDFYCHSIRVTYLPKPTVQQYVRTHTHMNLNTLCYPYQIDSYTGATFYTMLYKAGGTADEPADIYLQEHVGALEAGKPYFYVPEGTELVCNYSGEYTAAGNDGNGTYGVYADMTDVTPGMYVTYNNLFTKAGTNVKLREYRAYVYMNEVSVDQQGPSYVPGRRVLRVSNANAPSSATDIENTSAEFGGSEKILENGVLYIIKNGAKYNAQGQMVK